MNTKTWIIFGAVCVAILGGLIAFSRSQKPASDTTGIDASSITKASSANGDIAEHVDGNASSKIRLIEYGDFQCPYCGDAHPVIKSVMEDYGDKISFVFRNFPLTTAHPNALAAATAVEAAGLQGKYWQMHNLVFESQSEWSSLTSEQRTARFTTYATQAGVTDLEKFKADISTGDSIKKKISFDQSLARGLGVTGTPAFFVNGEKVDQGIQSSIIKGEDKLLRELLDKKLKEENIAPPEATAN